MPSVAILSQLTVVVHVPDGTSEPSRPVKQPCLVTSTDVGGAGAVAAAVGIGATVPVARATGAGEIVGRMVGTFADGVGNGTDADPAPAHAVTTAQRIAPTISLLNWIPPWSSAASMTAAARA